MFLLKGATEGRTVMTEERANDLFQKWVMSLVDDPDDRMIGAVVHQLVDDLAKSLVAAMRENAVSV